MGQSSFKRVLVVVSHPLGGIRSYLLYNLPTLADAGYSFSFLAPQGAAFESFKADTKDWRNVTYLDAPVRSGKCHLRGSVRRALKDDRYSLIHSQGLRAGTASALARYGRNVPLVMTLHDVIGQHNEMPGRWKWFKKRIVGRITACADVIIAVSNDCCANYLREFPEWKQGTCRVEVVRNGVDVQRLIGAEPKEGGADSLERPSDVSQETIVIGYFGRFMPEKGFLVLLDALRLLATKGYRDRLRLVATKDPHGYRGEYMREVQQDDVLSQMVRFVEPVSDIGPLLSQMDALIMPSLWEACPLLPMEAMVLGVPVVGSDAIGLREVLRDTPAETPTAGDPGALAVAIERAIHSVSKKAACAFMTTAQTRFDNRMAAIRLREIYDSVANE